MLPNDILLFTQSLLVMLCLGYFIYFNHQKSITEKHSARVMAESEKIIENARLQALNTQRNALIQAQQILKHAQYFNTNSQDQIKTAVDQRLNAIEGKALESAEITISEIQNATVEDLQKYQDQLKQAALRAQEYIAQKSAEGFSQLDLQLAEYRKQRIAQIDQEIIGAVQHIAQDVLHKSFTSEDHRQLILDALEKAKQDGILKI